jgi:hypothetical protein
MPMAARDDFIKSVFGIDVAALRRPGRAPAPPARAASGPASLSAKKMATFAKAREAWIATRKKIEADIGKLHRVFNSAFKAHPKGRDLGAAFKARADQVLDTLDEALAHKLDEITRNTDSAQHQKLVLEARAIIRRYEATVANNQTIAALDANPFASVAIAKTMTATLSALSKAVA